MVYILSVILVTQMHTLVKTRHAVHGECISPYVNYISLKLTFFSQKCVLNPEKAWKPCPGCI